jgi:hypothetical protein
MDKIILRGRDPDEPVSLLSYERLRYACIAAIIVVVMGMGFLLTANHLRQVAICEERNARSVATGRATAKLARAHDLDGNSHAAAAWREFQRESALNPTPKC